MPCRAMCKVLEMLTSMASGEKTMKDPCQREAIAAELMTRIDVVAEL